MPGGSRSILATLLALAMLTVPAVAVSPLDDDAGSGMDAPDNATLAVPAGSFAGALTPPVDRLDDYAFHAEAARWSPSRSRAGTA